MKIIYGICAWGLGHATRSLPLIRKLIEENHELTIISSGRSLQLLKKELNEKAEYMDMPGYPMLLSKNSRQFLAKSMIYWPKFIANMEKSLQKLTKILKHKKCDLIISDGKYEIYSKKIPTYFISHQMRIMNPLRIKMFETGSEIFNLFFFKRYKGIIIPDYKKNNLSGDLSHNLKLIKEKKLHYVGALSDFNKKNIKKDIDYLISISGPEPQRTFFEKKILSQIQKLDGKIVVTLGKTETEDKWNQQNIETYSFVNKEKREELLNRAKIMISRSGYSTILDLAVIGTKALMSPTPGQIEQEYLAKYHRQKKTFHTVNQDKINLDEDIKIAEKRPGIKRNCDVENTVENIMQIITETK
ncbi:MAG: glycosyltransferase family protein [Candidatus Thermoplasmatota archaeon]